MQDLFIGLYFADCAVLFFTDYASFDMSNDNKPFVPKTPMDFQKLKLERLMANPDKPVVIPEMPKEKKGFSVPEFVRNVMGSSAGAGSGEFHVYRHLRRKEYTRQKMIDEKGEKEKLDVEFQEKLEENKRKMEEKTAKKRAKRLKRKEKLKEKRKQGTKKQGTSKDESSSQEESEEESDKETSEQIQEHVETSEQMKEQKSSDQVQELKKSSEGEESSS